MAARTFRVLAPVWLTVVVVAAACGSGIRAMAARPWDLVREAVDGARSANSFHVRGALGATVKWDGVVVGKDEQYRIWAMGMLLDERRIDGIAWGRPVDGSQPWISVPSDGSFDLGALLRGEVASSTGTDGHAVVQLHFTDDVLRALAHIPSVGPTDATVSIQSGLISAIDLRLQGGLHAHIELGDYAKPLTVEPVDGADSAHSG